MINKAGYVELGLSCADICKVLDQVANGERENRPSPSVFRAIEQLTM